MILIKRIRAVEDSQMVALRAARILREKHPSARVVMLSSLVYSESLNEARPIRARAFVGKSFGLA